MHSMGQKTQLDRGLGGPGPEVPGRGGSCRNISEVITRTWWQHLIGARGGVKDGGRERSGSAAPAVVTVVVSLMSQPGNYQMRTDPVRAAWLFLANVCGQCECDGGWNELTADTAHARGRTVVHTQLV